MVAMDAYRPQPGSSKISAIANRWRGLKLAQQFVAGSAIVLLAGMAAIGWWVTHRITHSVTTNSAHAAALYMESSVAPLIQELQSAEDLMPATLDRLDGIINNPAIRDRIVSMKIWRLDGTIVYSRWRDMIGKKFEPTESFARAAAGEVAAEFESDPHLEDQNERQVAKPLVEIYAPVRGGEARKVIAVSEFYARGDKLAADLREATILSGLVVGAVTFLMMSALFGIVYRGSRTIDEQQRQLTKQIGKLESNIIQMEELRQRLQQSNSTVADINERILQRIGADLHDGPAQLLTYALLRLGSFSTLAGETAGEKAVRELQQMHSALSNALGEIRNTSAGLSLPGLETATLQETIALAVARHQEHTGTRVRVDTGTLPGDAPLALRTCIYRFVQEALSNAYRHAGARDQCVSARLNGKLRVTVSDSGPGFVIDGKHASGLGLTGMRARIEALGGTLHIEADAGSGARLTALFDLQPLPSRGNDNG
jgi:signal transduction histidine kinase